MLPEHKAVRHMTNMPGHMTSMRSASMYFKQKIIFKNDDRYFKHPLPVQIRLSENVAGFAIVLFSMACQRPLIFDFDAQDA